MIQKKEQTLFVLLTIGICYLLGIVAYFTQGENENPVYDVLQTGFTFLPVLAALITRSIIKSDKSFNLSLRVWKQPMLWAFSAIIPGVLVSIGAVLYFLINRHDYSGKFNYGEMIKLLGVSVSGTETIESVPLFCLICIVIAAVIIPVQLLELGEEIGWRGYLLPMQIKRYGVQKGVILNSFLWGIAHMPLIWFGFNYSSDNAGAPWSNMAMMMLVCMALGVICSYVTIAGGNCMYAGIVHGVINIIGEIPVFLSVGLKSTLIGPNPTGVIGMSALIICAVVMFVRLDKVPNKLSE